ncbi:hypothetical protein K2X33_08150 [bacterium]|nr:hypothetical protein [bacterium]
MRPFLFIFALLVLRGTPLRAGDADYYQAAYQALVAVELGGTVNAGSWNESAEPDDADASPVRRAVTDILNGIYISHGQLDTFFDWITPEELEALPLETLEEVLKYDLHSEIFRFRRWGFEMESRVHSDEARDRWRRRLIKLHLAEAAERVFALENQWADSLARSKLIYSDEAWWAGVGSAMLAGVVGGGTAYIHESCSTGALVALGTASALCLWKAYTHFIDWKDMSLAYHRWQIRYEHRRAQRRVYELKLYANTLSSWPMELAWQVERALSSRLELSPATAPPESQELLLKSGVKTSVRYGEGRTLVVVPSETFAAFGKVREGDLPVKLGALFARNYWVHYPELDPEGYYLLNDATLDAPFSKFTGPVEVWSGLLQGKSRRLASYGHEQAAAGLAQWLKTAEPASPAWKGLRGCIQWLTGWKKAKPSEPLVSSSR